MVGAVPGERVCLGLGRETPGSETLDGWMGAAISLHFNLYCGEAAMFLGEVTVRPLLVASLLFGDYHAWVGGVKIKLSFNTMLLIVHFQLFILFRLYNIKSNFTH